MRVVLDTNVLISALIGRAGSLPARLITLWRRGRFQLISSSQQIEELKRVTRYPKIAARLKPSLAGRLVNQVESLTIMVVGAPEIDVSSDPDDNYLLSIAEIARADYLVTGDKPHLLRLRDYRLTKIVTIRDFLRQIGESDDG